MIRYEANIDGSVEVAEPYNKFNEVQVFIDILDELDWQPELIYSGQGGYYKFYEVDEINII